MRRVESIQKVPTVIVSIHIRLGRRMRRQQHVHEPCNVSVSIHIRLGRRMRRAVSNWIDWAEATGFNPHPPRKADETLVVPKLIIDTIDRFNPHPPRKADETRRAADLRRRVPRVSIHIRLGRRMRHQTIVVMYAEGFKVSIHIRLGRRMRRTRCPNERRQVNVSIHIRLGRRMRR